MSCACSIESSSPCDECDTGIVHSRHPLCDGNTFQVLDGATRLYSMPFSTGAHAAERETFWQLSFTCTEAEALRYRCAVVCHAMLLERDGSTVATAC